ncbi:MAG TPA: hypothetical protein VJK07_03360 [Candidatus Nanoarchaeia archaeon]|nr:hypothetical protein [Candidatus Nanoarchaeia archaeon]
MALSYSRLVSMLAVGILLEFHVLLQLQQPEFVLRAVVVALAHAFVLTKEAPQSQIINGYAQLAILESAIHLI